MQLNHIALTQFRNHSVFRRDIKAYCTFIFGKNGAGKTSILEAISLFMPGRGFKAKSLTDVIKRDIKGGQLCQAYLSGDEIDSVCSVSQEGRKSFKNASMARDSSGFRPDSMNIVYLVPEMNALFTGPASDRRKFFDNVAHCLLKNHSEHLNKYKYQAKSRLHLLRSSRYDEFWLSNIEKQMAKYIIRIEMARFITSNILAKVIRDMGWHYGNIDIVMDSQVLGLLDMTDIGVADFEEMFTDEQDSFRAEEIFICKELRERRAVDASTGMTNFGCHRTDFNIMIGSSHVSTSSTGEQKRMLLTLVMGKVKCIRRPCVLLDDVLAHLDTEMQSEVFAILNESGAQVFLTTSSEEHCANILKSGSNKVDIWSI